MTDFINFIGVSPLTGPNDPTLGERFPPLFDPFDPAMQEAARKAARQADFTLREGVYIGIAGPAYNTRAELHAWRVLGADAVGMSTVLEVMAARHLSQRVLGLSVITDMAVPEREEHTTEQQVIEAAMRAGSRLQALVRAALPVA
ncbi:MAG TPA: purine-nucleoside phosphorylase, partial [Deinococcales bacterium]|nr:purine-nucleoside phosphorylase [Deinococcales bacterium]